MDKFEAYYSPRKNITYKRHVFNMSNQQAGGNIDAYVIDLENKANCVNLEINKNLDQIQDCMWS